MRASTPWPLTQRDEEVLERLSLVWKVRSTEERDREERERRRNSLVMLSRLVIDEDFPFAPADRLVDSTDLLLC